MKKLKSLIVLLLAIPSISFAQDLRAYLNYARFSTPDDHPYVETYLNVNGASLHYEKDPDGNWSAKVNVQVVFTKGGAIIAYDKYTLHSPSVADTMVPHNLLDVKRYALSDGEIGMDVWMCDPLAPADTLKSSVVLNMDMDPDKLEFSDIELVSSFSKGGEGDMAKNGFTLVPHVFNYFPDEESKLNFYVELYNTPQVLGDQGFVVTYYIRPFEVDKKLDQYFRVKRMDSAPVQVLLSSFDITDLPSGNFLLVVEARNKDNVLMSSREAFFQRYNPRATVNMNNLLTANAGESFAGKITNRDTLVEYIQYLTPISTDMERQYASSAISSASLDELQRYFLGFWLDRDKTDPAQAWADYLFAVKQVNHKFSSVSLKGYLTDRGRVYLQYGPPNVVSENYHEPAAYPYEIWQYYQLGDQRDKKFVFYSHDNVTNDFQLIHSNAVGELSNYRWETVVYRRTWDPYSLDDAVIPDTYGSGATQNYLQPGSR